MSQKIQVRRGVESTRTNVTFDVGEPLWAIDSKKFYVGDGVTAGGIPIGTPSLEESMTSVIASAGLTAVQAGALLTGAVGTGNFKRPYGLPRSEFNPYTILLYPGHYHLSQTLLLSGRVNLIGISSNRNDVILSFADTMYINPTSGNTIANLSIITTSAPPFSFPTPGIYKDITIKNVFDSGSVGDFANGGFLGFTPDVTGDNFLLDGVENGPAAAADASAFSNGLFSLGQEDRYVFKNSKINNCKFHGPSFAASRVSGSTNNIIQNSEFILNRNISPGHFCCDGGNKIIGLDSSNIFKNCVFSGGNIGIQNGLTIPFSPTFQDCLFKSNIGYLQGRMENCTIDARYVQGHTSAILINSAAGSQKTGYPIFNNCTIFSSGGTCVTGNSTSPTNSGLFMHCRLNNNIATGVTGLFGNQYNIIHSSLI